MLGRDGLLGAGLAASLTAHGQEVLGTSRRTGALPPGTQTLDLSGDLTGWTPPQDLDTAFLCAAVTSLARCRQDPAQTFRVNVDNTLRAAERLLRTGAFVVFPSSNLVFDGERPLRRAEETPCPRTEYGRQKAEAEKRLLALGPGVAVVRLTKVLAPAPALLAGWREALLSGRPVEPFRDMVFSPVSLSFAVRALRAVAEAREGGIWQVSASADLSYAQAAGRLCRLLGAEPSLLRPVSWRQAAPDLEHVPAHTSLDASRLAGLGLPAPSPETSLDEVFKAA